MVEYFRRSAVALLNEECYQEFFEKFNFFHVPCLKLALSKCLGYAIIAGSVMVKVPQILKITRAKSAEGLSIFSILLDLFAITSSAAYQFNMGFPFSAWGEGLFLILQTAAIAALTLYHGPTPHRAALFLAAYVAVTGLLMGGAAPVALLWAMQVLNVPVVIAGKSLQALANYRNGGTGQLSAATGFLLLAGSLARIFTSVQETGDATVVLTYVAASAVNALIAAQIVYYWRGPTSSRGDKRQ
ncbi:mannose-P-dolichol utilization defect 1 protein homolog [Bacillus rossius redtenbacheri]|uniref:mannose-P-dolichol utilization defect 1 protein homolog n=1 Tax=Bacillus rossius redtenbacheri TaxID=93214 RepID=UPI002FDE1B64